MASRWLACVGALVLACGEAEGNLPGAGSAGGGGTGGSSSTPLVDAGGGTPAAQLLVDEVAQAPVRKIDLLFMIDNSISMSDKQEVLRAAVPDLVSRLVNPICVDAQGNQYPAPPEGTASCPAGQTREFDPVQDINVGIVSSSLGDVGANVACPAQPTAPRYVQDRADMAHLMGSLERSSAQTNPQGFLEWRAGSAGNPDVATFNANFQRMVTDVGENGCGWEASLESWYRFLIDPVPYRELTRVQCRGSSSTALNCVQPATDANDRVLLDETLLAQRAAFLRDDSLVAVIMLTDENDCSAQVGNQTWVLFNIEDTRTMFKGSTACATDPNDKCCYSCPLNPPEGCAVDPACSADPLNVNRLPPELDGQNLRCYQQKRRFGVDVLYPTQRYVNAVTQRELCWNAMDLSVSGCAAEDLRPNPLFQGGRSQSLVFLGGIVGVPWQAIDSEVDANGRPLAAASILRFKTYPELTRDGAWAEILGSPGVPWRAADAVRPEVAGVPATPPTLPQMVETPSVRPGVIVGNALNGRDYDTTQGTGTLPGSVPRADDLQYACIFPLATPRDCSQLDPNTDNCDCFSGVFDQPLCEQTPGVTPPGTTQYWAKAYPGVRELQVLRDFGAASSNSIVASICARNVTEPSAPDFGYRPAIAAVVAGVKDRLGSRCLPRPLDTADDGSVPCTLVEATPQPPRDAVTGAVLSCPPCDAQLARKALAPEVEQAVRGQLARAAGSPCGALDPSCSSACACELQQVQQVAGVDGAEALRACRDDEAPAGIEGWCYIDPALGLGSPALVSNCSVNERRRIRFPGAGPAESSKVLLVCPEASP